MSEGYIRSHFHDILTYARKIETRLDDGCTPEALLRDKAEALRLCRLHQVPYYLIDGEYPADFGL